MLVLINVLILVKLSQHINFLCIVGGFKLWECAVDLAEHLCTLWGVKSHHNSKSWLQSAVSDEATEKRVLDLGCGHGLPGILAACIGMETHFQAPPLPGNQL